MEIQEVKEQLKDIFRAVINNDKWITIHPNGEDGKGRPLLLKDGESPKEAIERTYGKGEKSDTKEERIEARRKHQEVVKKHNQAYKDFEDGKISMEELEKADKELEKSNKEFYGQPDTKDKQSDSKDDERHENFRRSLAAHFSDYGNIESKRELTKRAKEWREKGQDKIADLIEESIELGDKTNQNKKDFINKKISYDEYVKFDRQAEKRRDEISEEIEQLQKQSDTKDGVNWKNKDYTNVSDDELREKLYDITKRLDEKHGSFENAPYSEKEEYYFYNNMLNKGYRSKGNNPDTKDKQSDSKGENEKYRSRFPDIQNLIGTLSKDDKYFDSKYRTAEKRLNEKLKFAKKELKERDFADMPSVKKSKEQIVKTIEEEIEKLKLMKDKNKQLRLFNNKEQDMALIEELKKLITKVENTKGEKDMEIENEKVDKRKLIDEVAGIMKSAGCDDEVIRTAIGKMEKMSYDDSEKSADNECEDKEDVKNCGKKVKNKDEEDKKEVEEIEEDVKEDVENRGKKNVKNSKTDYFAKLNEIYNSAANALEKCEYVSRADREKAAEDYFAR